MTEQDNNQELRGKDQKEPSKFRSSKRKQVKTHDCKSFGKFLTGAYKEVFEVEPKFKIGQLEALPDLVGR